PRRRTRPAAAAPAVSTRRARRSFRPRQDRSGPTRLRGVHSGRLASVPGETARRREAGALRGRQSGIACSLLLRNRAAGWPGDPRGIQKLRTLLVIGITGQPLPRLVVRRQPVIPILVRVRRAEHGGIGP